MASIDQELFYFDLLRVNPWASPRLPLRHLWPGDELLQQSPIRFASSRLKTWERPDMTTLPRYITTQTKLLARSVCHEKGKAKIQKQ